MRVPFFHSNNAAFNTRIELLFLKVDHGSFFVHQNFFTLGKFKADQNEVSLTDLRVFGQMAQSLSLKPATASCSFWKS